MRYLILTIITALLCGCTAAKAVVAMNKSTDTFEVLESDSRVRYEIGSEINAQIVADNLDRAIGLIEQRQYSEFAKPVDIYVTATVDSFTSFCVLSRAGGCVLNERLFISPKPENTPERIPQILTHELSHLHMEQHVGVWKWKSNVPAWFREGLAVYASDGSGAESVSREEAEMAIVSGKMFTPNITGSLLFPKTANTFGLKPHMFYRQADLFVSWLHEKDMKNFGTLIANIQAGETIEKAMRNAFGVGVLENWQRFINEQKT